MRKEIVVYINGERNTLAGELALMSIAEFLRYKKGLTGTKIVCSEGDCGACTILLSSFENEQLSPFKTINSCISYMYLLDKCHIISVEGVGKASALDPVQKAMVKCHGAQCGYCTPGFVCAMAGFAQDLKENNKSVTVQKIKNNLAGNLCRCTGYEPIIKAGVEVDYTKVELYKEKYTHHVIEQEFSELCHDEEDVLIIAVDKEVFIPQSLNSALKYLNQHSDCLITSGATDLGVVQNKGKLVVSKILVLNNLSELSKFENRPAEIELGAKLNLAEVENHCEDSFKEFSHLLHIFASPQIKNMATLAGNLVNASPIADTVPFLRVAEAVINITSVNGVRHVNINDFIGAGYKQIDLAKNEIIYSITLPKDQYDFKLYKVSTRKDLDISTVTFACRYKLVGTKIKDISFAMGGVGPIVYRLKALEKQAIGKDFTQKTFKDLACKISGYIAPMSDHRGSADFRFTLAENLFLRFFDEVVMENSMEFREASI